MSGVLQPSNATAFLANNPLIPAAVSDQQTIHFMAQSLVNTDWDTVILPAEPATEWSAEGSAKNGDYSTTSDLENNAKKHGNLGPDKNSFINPRMSSTIYITPNTDEDGMPIRKGTKP